VRQAVQDCLRLSQYGWHMTEPLSDYDQADFEILGSARRFEAGSPNSLGIHALQASVALLLEQGMDRVGARVLEHSRYLAEKLRRIDGVELISDLRESRRSGIVTFRPGSRDARKLCKRMMGRGVLCAPRGGGLRFSPHFYLDRDQLDEALDILGEEMRRGAQE
jgi:selenocysteine lyase/cysteine desulfurase